MADERGGALAGAPGATVAPGDGRPAADVVVRLGGPEALGAADCDALWIPGPAPEGANGAPRVLATAGEALWSRAPWPARDELFELPPPAAQRLLVVSPDEARREEVAARLRERSHDVAAAEALDVDELASASAVALLGHGDAMPAEAPAVLAARRVLLGPRVSVTFGLLPGTDHLAFGDDRELVQCADAVLTFPDSFEPFRVLGACTAARFRASTVYERIAAAVAAEPSA